MIRKKGDSAKHAVRACLINGHCKHHRCVLVASGDSVPQYVNYYVLYRVASKLSRKLLSISSPIND